MSRMFSDVVMVEPTHTAHWISKIFQINRREKGFRNARNAIRHFLGNFEPFIPASKAGV